MIRKRVIRKLVWFKWQYWLQELTSNYAEHRWYDIRKIEKEEYIWLKYLL